MLKSERYQKAKFNYITWLFLFCLFFFYSSNVQASVGDEPSDHLEVILADIIINHDHLPEVVPVYFDEKEHVWVPESLLAQMHLLPQPLPTQLIDEQVYVLLTDYPGVTHYLNQSVLELIIKAPDDAFSEQIINDTDDQTIPNRTLIRPESPGAFLNYTLFSQYAESGTPPTNTNVSALTELGLFNQFGTGSLHYIFQNINNKTSAVRLDASWTQDQPENLARWRVGDSITSSANWSGAVRFGGIQYSTNFATQPGLVTMPLPDIQGQAALPSTVNLLINNVASQQNSVRPGPFVINNVPVVSGAGTISVITEDILGRQEIITLPYYAAPQLLKEGLTNFSYEAGFIRDNYGMDSNDYGQAVGTVTVSKGLSNTFTVTGHGELLKNQQTIGATGNYLWNNFGVVSFSLAASQLTGQGGGGLFSLGFNRQARGLSYGTQATLTTQKFTQIGLLSGQAAPASVVQAYSGYDLGQLGLGSLGSLSVSYTNTQARSNMAVLNSFAPPTSELITASYSNVFFKRVSLSLNSIQDLRNSQNNQISLMLTMSIDSLYTTSAGATRQNSKQRYTEQFTKSLPLGTGYGYQVYGSQGDSTQNLMGSITAQNEYGQYNAAVSRFNNQNNYQANISGSVIHFGGVTAFARNFDSGGASSFGLVQVPGFENVRIYQQNQLIGTTNAKGNLFIPNLLPYQKNKIDIDPTDLPIDAYIEETEKNIIPYYKSGSIAVFPVKKLHSVIFSLITQKNKYVPTGALLKIKHNEQNFLVGEQGQVYLDNAQEERVQGTAYWDTHQCQFEFTVPDHQEIIPNLGEVLCH